MPLFLMFLVQLPAPSHAEDLTIEILFPLPDMSFTLTDVTLRVRITGPDGVDASSIMMTLDGSNLNINWDADTNIASAEVTGLDQGVHIAKAWALNPAGSGLKIVNWTFIVDQEPPWSIIYDVEYVQRIWDIHVDAKAFDNLSVLDNIELYYRKDGGAWISWGRGGRLLRTGEFAMWWEIPVNETGGAGFYEFYTIATDAAGNREQKSPYPEASLQVILPPDPIGDLFRMILLSAMLGFLFPLVFVIFEIWRSRSIKNGVIETPFSSYERNVKRFARSATIFTAFAVPMHVAAIAISLHGLKVISEVASGRTIEWGEMIEALYQNGFFVVVLAGIVVQVCFAIVAAVAAYSFCTRQMRFAPVAIASGVIAIVLSIILMGGIVGAVGGILTIIGGVIAIIQPSIISPSMYSIRSGSP